ncbi:hypothetical protein RBQ61_15630 [Sedimentibacter sp. MB35-C1]|nr:hypothetical protein [Sedimentibacter sp. MB35-C1]WMJ76985.1 hypothetical protein RBQ61_15630 [Sedimentibacter sp. MB35-C1]
MNTAKCKPIKRWDTKPALSHGGGLLRFLRDDSGDIIPAFATLCEKRVLL